MSFYNDDTDITRLSKAEPSDDVSISADGRGFVLVDQGGIVLAVSPSAKALGKWAFNHGAARVKYDFDLKMDEGNYK